MRKRLILSLFFIVPMLAMAQMSSMYDKDMNAFTLAAGLETGKYTSGYTCLLDLTLKSRIEIEGLYTRTEFGSSDQYIYDAYINGVSGVVTWWLLNEPINQSLNFNLGLKVGADNYSYTDYYYMESDEVMLAYRGYSVGKVGLDLALNYWINDQWMARPSAVVFGEMGKSSIESSSTISKNSYKGITSKVGIYLAKRLNFDDVLYVYPNLLFNSHERKAPVMVNLTVGFMVGY